MINVEAQYFRLSRNFMLAVGLWPYQQPLLAQLQYIFNLGILVAAIIFHFTSFITTECTVDFVIEVLSFVFIFFSYVIKYNAFWFNSKTVRILLEQLQCMCDELKDENEVAIIERYGNISKRYIYLLSVLTIGGLSGFFLMQSLPSILDIVLPRNETRPRRLLLPVEYFLDRQRYFYLMMLHINIALCIGTAIVLAIATLLFAYMECICGMFAIASYRIECALRTDILRNVSSNTKDLISERIIMAVDIHRKAIKICELIVSTFDVMITALVMIGVSSMSLNVFRVFQIMSSKWNVGDIILPTVFITVIFLYMFLGNYVAQSVTDHNSHIFSTVYNVQWYRAPLHVQRLTLFLLQKGKKDFILTIGGLITGSLESFTMMINTSMSYFTVMYTTQN